MGLFHREKPRGYGNTPVNGNPGPFHRPSVIITGLVLVAACTLAFAAGRISPRPSAGLSEALSAPVLPIPRAGDLTGDLKSERFVAYTPEVKAAVEKGLVYLASKQEPNGAWKNKVGYKFNEMYSGPVTYHVGTTALACLAFMANGSVPGRGKYGENVERGLDFILSCVNAGYVTANGSRMYSHTFATLFLAEIYGMTDNGYIKEGLTAAIDLIIKHQRPDGGWRYTPGATSKDSDISVTVCCVQALRAARNQGFHVPKETIARAMDYIRRCYENREMGRRWGYMMPIKGSFKYQDDGSETIPVTRTSVALTAAGVTSLMSGGDYSSEMVKMGVNFISRYSLGYDYDHQVSSLHFFYGHYYAVQAMYQYGGSLWEKYFTALSAKLLNVQNRNEGFWDDRVVGKNYATSMGCLILQITNGYLPIFQR